MEAIGGNFDCNCSDNRSSGARDWNNLRLLGEQPDPVPSKGDTADHSQGDLFLGRTIVGRQAHAPEAQGPFQVRVSIRCQPEGDAGMIPVDRA